MPEEKNRGQEEMKKHIKKLTILATGVMIMLSLFGCGKKKYELILDNSLESKKTSYAAGEQVKVCCSLIATDTDYNFFSNDVKMQQDYTNEDGYVLSLIMPAHDVKIMVSMRNSMVYDPEATAEKTEEQLLALAVKDWLIFDYYDGTVGTDGFDGYDEFCLYRQPDGGLIMAKFSNWPDRKEQHACQVWPDVLYELLNVVDKYDMRHWTKGSPIDGQAYRVSFAEAERMITVSSNLIPENGIAAFAAVRKVMEETWNTFAPKE